MQRQHPAERRPQQATLADKLKTLPQYALPQHLISRVVLKATRWRWPPWKNLLIHWFIRRYRVDMTLAVESQPEHYDCFNSFFTRALRPEVRPQPQAADAVACPVDGSVSQAGEIRDELLFQAKGRAFSLAELLAGDAAAAGFRNGRFATLYLSPRDYHRIHMPMDGVLRRMIHVPGRLFSVNARTTRVVDRLFARNERVVCLFDSPEGPMAVILVGAINVGSIETVWAGAVTPARGRRIRVWDYDPGQVSLKRGQELGRFNMGSTVILLFPQGVVEWSIALQPESSVRTGMAIGRVLAGTAPSP